MIKKDKIMARDDYFVIVYKVLTYLYQCLKEGTKVEERLLTHESPYIKVSEKYWNYILWHMQKAELIEGVEFLGNNLGDIPYPLEWNKCRITPNGIAYLSENSLMKKAKDFLKDIKEITPFI